MCTLLEKEQHSYEKKVNKNSQRIMRITNNKDNIFIHTAERCAFYKSLEQKPKAKKATFWKYRVQ